MKVSGFSIIRDGVKFGYPFLQSIQSVLPLVDEFVIAVGKSDDETLERVRSLDSPKLRIIETVWDEELCRGGQVMAQQTNLALDACSGDWCFYIQGDEVIHEKDYPVIRKAMERHLSNRRVEGLSFRYRHFYASYKLINPIGYRHQIRIVRGGIGVRSVGDACGFGIAGRKLRKRHSGAKVYHYGWVRNPVVMSKKNTKFASFYHERAPQADTDDPPAETYESRIDICVPFSETHPTVMHEVVAAQDWSEPTHRYVPLWRNLNWWDAFFDKSFRSIYRHLPKKKRASKRTTATVDKKKAA